jgi:cell division protein FtsB
MTRNRIIFYIVFGVYQLLAFVFTIIMESSASFLFKLVGFVGWFKYITFFGVVLIAADFIWLWMDSRKQRRLEDGYRHENNTLKAKVYDLQEGSKPKPEVPKAK